LFLPVTVSETPVFCAIGIDEHEKTFAIYNFLGLVFALRAADFGITQLVGVITQNNIFR